MEKLLELYPMIWLIFIASGFVGVIGCIIGIFASIIDIIFKPKSIFLRVVANLHVVANITYTISIVPFVISLILIMIDHFIYDFIRTF